MNYLDCRPSNRQEKLRYEKVDQAEALYCNQVYYMSGDSKGRTAWLTRQASAKLSGEASKDI